MRLLQLIVLLVATPAAAQSLDLFEARFAFYDQDGRGFQSLAGPAAGPGSESTLIFEPLLRALIRQDDAWTHDLSAMVDIVSAASPDAIDVMSSASKVNEAVTLDVVSQWAPPTGHHKVAIRYGFHIEEPLRSGFLGASYGLRLAEDNTTLTASVFGSFDVFDPYHWRGYDPGLENRQAINLNFSWNQVLSPTTVLDAAYGFTFQTGLLSTTYNSVPVDDDDRGDEIFPSTRERHAVTLRLAQIIPATGTTLKLQARHYFDDFGLGANTVQAWAYQYLTAWLYLRGGYRWHDQTGVDFYGERFTGVPAAAQTADSDLAPFTSHEISGKLVLLADRSPLTWLRRSFIDLSFARYWRTNDLDVLHFQVAWGRRF
jgi:Protein of unknown function (DUF3570)